MQNNGQSQIYSKTSASMDVPKLTFFLIQTKFWLTSDDTDQSVLQRSVKTTTNDKRYIFFRLMTLRKGFELQERSNCYL